MRVPEIISLVYLGAELEDDLPAPALHRMSDREAARFIAQCDAALRSHARDFRVGPEQGDALAAFESVMALLLEVREVYSAKRADIDKILVRFGYPVPEN